MKHTAITTDGFKLSAEQHAALADMRPADRALELEILAQSHHFRTFPVIGKYRSLDGVPQMADWQRNRDRLMAEAVAQYDSWFEIEPARAAETTFLMGRVA